MDATANRAIPEGMGPPDGAAEEKGGMAGSDAIA
jgi:hypothetical protein